MELRPTKDSQSIADYLIRLMPGLEMKLSPIRDMIDPVATKSLFVLWKDEQGKINGNVYKRPSTMSCHQVDAMKQAGLIKDMGSRVEITDKGSRILRIMLLGDDHSVFDSDEQIVDYSSAVKNMKKANKTRSSLQKSANAWWSRFEDII